MIDDLEITDYDELDNCTISFVSKQERAPVRIIEAECENDEQEASLIVGDDFKQQKTAGNDRKGRETVCFKSIADIVRLLPYVKKFKKVGINE